MSVIFQAAASKSLVFDPVGGAYDYMLRTDLVMDNGVKRDPYSLLAQSAAQKRIVGYFWRDGPCNRDLGQDGGESKNVGEPSMSVLDLPSIR